MEDREDRKQREGKLGDERGYREREREREEREREGGGVNTKMQKAEKDE